MDDYYSDEEENSEDRMWNRLWAVLYDVGPEDLVYVYDVDKYGRPIKPYRTKFWLDEDLIWTLQTRYGTGLYRILIKSGRVMRFSGTIGVQAPLQAYRPSAF